MLPRSQRGQTPHNTRRVQRSVYDSATQQLQEAPCALQYSTPKANTASNSKSVPSLISGVLPPCWECGAKRVNSPLSRCSATRRRIPDPIYISMYYCPVLRRIRLTPPSCVPIVAQAYTLFPLGARFPPRPHLTRN